MMRVDSWALPLHGQFISFLTAHQKICAGFLERARSFAKNGNADRGHCFLLRGGEGGIKGAVLFLPGGIVFHCLPAASSRPFRDEASALLLPVAASRPVFCVTGSLDGTLCLDGVYKTAGRSVLESRVYHLMERAPGQTARRCPPGTRGDAAGKPPAIIECKPEHADALFPLRKEYELIEVYPSGVEFSEGACRVSLCRNLEEGRVAGIRRAGPSAGFAAMAVVNARAESVAQIGGVYTLPEFRNRGYAAALAGFLAQKASREGKTCVLFAHTDNAPAIRSYERAGFAKIGYYGITYYV